MHYQFRITENFKFGAAADGLADFNGGFVYNLRNTDNPASAGLYRRCFGHGNHGDKVKNVP
ncbi:MAG: DUF3316 domain-containing protein [Bacteroides graminisolvens]